MIRLRPAVVEVGVELCRDAVQIPYAVTVAVRKGPHEDLVDQVVRVRRGLRRRDNRRGDHEEDEMSQERLDSESYTPISPKRRSTSSASVFTALTSSGPSASIWSSAPCAASRSIRLMALFPSAV